MIADRAHCVFCVRFLSWCVVCSGEVATWCFRKSLLPWITEVSPLVALLSTAQGCASEWAWRMASSASSFLLLPPFMQAAIGSSSCIWCTQQTDGAKTVWVIFALSTWKGTNGSRFYNGSLCVIKLSQNTERGGQRRYKYTWVLWRGIFSNKLSVKTLVDVNRSTFTLRSVNRLLLSYS